jgi:hypothetical protein
MFVFLGFAPGGQGKNHKGLKLGMRASGTYVQSFRSIARTVTDNDGQHVIIRPKSSSRLEIAHSWCLCVHVHVHVSNADFKETDKNHITTA